MKKLNANDLRALKHGDRVYRFNQGSMRGLDFVGLMPGCENYLILSDGEYLTHLHISPRDDTFNYEWYSGPYDSKFVGKLMIERLEKKIESVKRIYLKD